MELAQYFKIAINKKASDLHLVEGSTPSLRINSDLIRIEKSPIPYGELSYAIRRMLDEHTWDRFNRKRDLDLSMEFFGHRFRINLHFQQGRVGLTARLVPREIPRPEDIGMSEVMYNLTHLNDGLVLVTGPSGVGKSTTLAAMIDLINTERRAHIITIEDPTEYIFKDKQSIIEQRQLGRDTQSFASALKYSLRQDPNVIMVGEMRDLETVTAAITAAKTGHLVLSTLHTSSAAETVERVLDFYPLSDQKQMANQLASVLRAVISQQLLPRKDGGLVAAREIMINNRAVANLIRNNQVEQINTVIQTSREEGMVSMNMAIDALYRQGVISETVAKNRKRDLETKSVYY